MIIIIIIETIIARAKNMEVQQCNQKYKIGTRQLYLVLSSKLLLSLHHLLYLC